MQPFAAMATRLDFDPIAEARRQWALHFDAAPLETMEAVTSVMRAQQIMLARLNAMLAPFELTFPRYEALMVLYFSSEGALPLGKLGDRLQVHPTSVTNIIDRLERADLVRRVPHESDRRTTLAAITDAGRELAPRATAALHEARFGTDALDDGQCAQLASLLREVRVAAGDFDA